MRSVASVIGFVPGKRGGINAPAHGRKSFDGNCVVVHAEPEDKMSTFRNDILHGQFETIEERKVSVCCIDVMVVEGSVLSRAICDINSVREVAVNKVEARRSEENTSELQSLIRIP